MLKATYSFLTSLNLGLWLMTGVMVTLALGSFTSASQSGLNDMPLLFWLQRAPLSLSWWLWLCIIFLAILFLNALVCSIDALRKKGRSIAPHLMHAGFLLVVVAHLFSSYGGFKQQMQLTEGGTIGFPDGDQVLVERISGEVGQMGMLSSYRAQLRVKGKAAEVQPNHPVFHQGYGIYLKEVALTPMPMALVEIHREPGAWAALFGALFFMAGNVMLLAQRKGR